MTIEEQINRLFTSECNRTQDKIIPGFYYTQSQYEGNSVYNEI